MIVKYNSFQKGFTLLEILIYLGLMMIIVGILFSYGWNILSIRVKSAVQRETLRSAMLAGERLKRELRSAVQIDQEHSVFGSVPGKIVFTTPSENITIESDADRISIQRGGDNPEFLMNDAARAREFQLDESVSGDGTVNYVGFSFIAESHYPELINRQEYQFSASFHSGAEIRSQ
jgi:hypothetical protein